VAELRLSFRLVDEWPDADAPTPAVRFDDNVPPDLRDRAVLVALVAPDDDEVVIDIPPTIFRGVETVPYQVRLGPNLTVVRYRHVIRSTNRPPTA